MVQIENDKLQLTDTINQIWFLTFMQCKRKKKAYRLKFL